MLMKLCFSKSIKIKLPWMLMAKRLIWQIFPLNEQSTFLALWKYRLTNKLLVIIDSLLLPKLLAQFHKLLGTDTEGFTFFVIDTNLSFNGCIRGARHGVKLATDGVVCQ